MKKIFLLFLSVFLISSVISSVYGFQVTLDPALQNFSVFRGELKNIEVNILNNFNYTIYNISIDKNNYFNSTNISSLSPNSSGVLTLIFFRNEIGEISTDVIFKFYKLINLTQTQKFLTINITRDSFVPNNLILYKGDSLNWINRDSLLHTVTDADGEFGSSDLEANQSFSHTFNTIKNHTVRDSKMGFTMAVEIRDNIIPTYLRTPSEDIVKRFSAVTTYYQTSLNLILYQVNFTLSINESTEGLLILKNTGNETARNITLKGEWLTFSRNYFDLNPSQQTYIPFNIFPISLNSSDLNNEVMKTISITGVNFPALNSSISVFVPLDYNISNIAQTNFSYADFEAAQKAICALFPVLCGGVIVKEKNITVYKSPEINYTYTLEDINNFSTRLTGLESLYNDLFKFIKERELKDESFNKDYLEYQKNSTITLEELRKKENANSLRQLIFYFSMAFIIIGLVGVIFYFKIYSIKSITQGDIY